MIRVVFYRKKDYIVGFESSGHAGYNDYGQDIVCAAVSVLIINCVNSIEQLSQDIFELDHSDGYMRFLINDQQNVSTASKLLLESLRIGIESITNEYETSYIQFEIEEV